MTDAYTDELFAPPDERFAPVIHDVSRLVMDPERFPDDMEEPMVAKGMGAIYTRTSHGLPMRDAVSAGHRERLMQAFYWPHHRRLHAAVAAGLTQHGQTLIIDGHSFPALPSPYEFDQTADRPDFCVGTDPYHTPDALFGKVVRLLNSAGYSVRINRPFSGALVPLAFYREEPRVHSIMIEVNRRLYMDEKTGERLRNFTRIQTLMRDIMLGIAQH